MWLPKPIQELVDKKIDELSQPVVAWLTKAPLWIFGIILLGFAIYLFRKQLFLLSQLTRKWFVHFTEGQTAIGRGRLTILISPLIGDKDNQATRRLAEALQEYLGNAIDVVRLPLREQLRFSSDNLNKEKEIIAKKANKLLKARHGDLLFWGEVTEKSIRLYFNQLESRSSFSNRYEYEHQSLTLPKSISQDIGLLLAGLIFNWEFSVTDSVKASFPQADKQELMLEKLKIILSSSIPIDLERFKGDLYYTKGLLLNHLGMEKGNNVFLQEAIVSYKEALKEKNRERMPLDWAKTINNLAIALARLGERERSYQSLEEAIIFFHQAMEERTRALVPQDWAETQNNLANAHLVLSELEHTGHNLKAAVASYRESLQIRTFELVPYDWAATQNNLGIALRRLYVLEENRDDIEESISAFQNALKIRTKEHMPLDWAGTQNNLGNTYYMLGVHEGNIQSLEKAIPAFQNALKIRTPEGVPYDWAMTQNNLGNALRALGEIENNVQYLKDAIKAFKKALNKFEQLGYEFLVDVARQNLSDLEIMINNSNMAS